MGRDRHHRRRRIHRLASRRPPARRGPHGHRARQPVHRPSAQHQPTCSATRASRSSSTTSPSTSTSTARSTRFSTSPRCPARSTTCEKPIQTLKVGALGTHKALGLARRTRAPLPARLDVGGVRRPAGAPAAGDLLGQRQPGRPARRVRRVEALRRSDDHGLPPLPRRRHAHLPHLQHLRPAHAARRRPRGDQLHRPGAARPAAHGVRRRLAHAQLLLRQRPGRRHRPPAGLAAKRSRSTSATRAR